MAYLALYRAFRPTTLNDVVRQEHIVTVLKNQIATGRIGHAYLFCGPRGTGKTSIAKIFASAINCETPIDGSACGKCPTCKALSDPSNLDISEIDAASNNGVDEMRDLREKVQYPPVAGKYKVYIIDEVHMLSTGAFNALLKTLEEPPKHAVFILATTEAAKLPATILSRCMRFDFKLIPQADLEERLEFVFDRIGKKYEKEAISAIARAGAGSVRDMLSIADTCASYAGGTLTYEAVTSVLGSADFEGVAKLCGAMLQGDAGVAFESAEAFLAAGKGVGTIVKDIMNFLNFCAVAKVCRGGRSILSLPESSYKTVEEIAKAADGHRLLRVSEIFAETEQALKYSTSPRVSFETAVWKASMPQTDYNIDALIARITELEKKIENGVTVKTVEVTEKSDTVVSKPVQTEEIEYETSDYDIPPEMDAPPPEEPTVFFDGGIAPKKEPAPVVKEQNPVKPAPTGDAKATFGAFLRSLRRTGKNGVLFTICMDLEYGYEDGLFVLYTQSDTIYRSLTKPEHFTLITTAFEAVGIGAESFAVRMKGKPSEGLDKSVNEIKETFHGVKIEIK